MNLRKYLENRFHGWLPKEPRQAGTDATSKIAASNQTNPRLRMAGNILSRIGIILILLVLYRFIVYVFNPAASLPVQIVFALGFVLLVAGMVLRVRSIESNVGLFRSPMLIVSLTLLTISVFGIAFNSLLGLNVITFTAPSVAAVVFSLVGFAGWLLLSKGQIAWLESNGLPRKSFSILAVGIFINLIVASIQVLLAFGQIGYPHSTSTETPLLLNIAILVFALLAPLGTVFSTYGWAAIFSGSLNRHRPVLLVVSAVFLAVVLTSLLL